MVSSSTKDRGEALWESLYRSTNGCCMWLGNIPDGKKVLLQKTVIQRMVLLMYVFAHFQVVSQNG